LAANELALGRRVARLSWLSVGLVGVAVVLVLVAVWVAVRTGPQAIVGLLPLAARDVVPPFSLVLAAGALAAGVFIGLAALHTAASMRVLARDRRIPAPLPTEIRKLRSVAADTAWPAGGAACR
jgi:biofilm PGA synthesis N-glycosyltransferase PgaC